MNEISTRAEPNESKRPRRRRWLLGCAGVLLASVLLAVLGVVRLDRPLPEGEAGPAADALAREMMAAVDVAAWERTGAVAWDFGGRQQHLWDRRRQLVRVGWGDGEEVLLDLTTRRGRAYRQGQEVQGPEQALMLEKAWVFWCNDSFWLNPIAKLFDQGTTRSLVSLPGDGDGGESLRGLLVAYESGGVTPGDSYLWLVGEDGEPRAWRMWTQILPLGGIEASWEGWQTLSTGARVATRHRLPIFTLELSDIRAADSAAELEGGRDPFAPLFETTRPDA